MVNLTVVDDAMVASMLNDPKYREAFPCLRDVKTTLSKKLRSCGSCGSKKVTVQQKSYMQAKQCLLSLSSGKRNELKALLNTHKIRFSMTDSKGKRIKWTF